MRIEVESPVVRTPRVMQVEAIFDLPASEKSRLAWDVDLPLDEQAWNVGLIVGPSGAGKSTIARRMWPDRIVGEQEWSPGGALVDDFPATMGVKDVTGLLTAVGLGSVPAWVRPYATLSNGEQFRASIARAVADTEGLVVVDEFTSVVDRQVAKVASHTVQKMIRRSKRQLVAVTCHYDVVDWLQPDWVYDVAEARFTWRSVHPHPPLHFTVHQVDRSVWPVFGRHHYLSPVLHPAAKCYGLATEAGDLVAFSSYLHFPHPHTRNIKLGHRLVVLPDYQGLGLGGRLDDWLGQHLYEQGYRYRNCVAHPAMIRYYSASPRWQRTSTKRRLVNSSTNKALRRRAINPRFLGTQSFQYVPPRKEGSA